MAAVAVIALLAGACASGDSESLAYVDLTQRVAVPAEGTGEVAPLRVAVAAILSPQGNVESYGALADYLSLHLDRPVEIVQRRTYQEINDLLQSADVDMGFVCTSAYVRGHDDFGLSLLAAPQIGGETVYYSDLIVAADSAASSIADLRGTVFAFTDPISTTGRIYPTFLVNQLGETPETFFEEVFFTYSHDRAIAAVAEGVADAAAVDSLVLDYALARDPTLDVKVIYRSPAFKIPPAVVSPGMPPQQAAALRDLLLNIATDPAAAPVLSALGIDGFVMVEDAAYDPVRDVIDSVGAGS